MKKLVNAEDRRILKEKIQRDTRPRITLSFYQYANILNPDFFRDFLFLNYQQFDVLGRIYVAGEGINAQISVPEDNFELFKDFMNSVDFLNGIRLNIAVDDNGKSFYKLIIKVRPKILADGLNDSTFDVTKKGKHLNAANFNAIIEEQDTLLIDMRNHYESEVGHFEGAITPDVDTFRDSLPVIEKHLKGHEDKKIVMYCTGGIRCEKASAWFKHRGFENVYQLEGGIIEYTRQVRENQLPNKFKGKNFVFDERLSERISDDVIARCHQCGNPADTHTNCANEGCHMLFIQCEACQQHYAGCCSESCKDITALPEEEQKLLRKGAKRESNIFQKGRHPLLRFKTVHNPLEVALSPRKQGVMLSASDSDE